MSNQPYKVLLVDDEELIRNQLEAILRKAPYTFAVSQCRSAQEALREIERQPPDIVISDIQMPEMNGLQFADALGDKINGLELIFVTGYAYFEYAQEAVRLGALDFILKPVQEENILACLDRAVKKIGEKKRVFTRGKALFFHPTETVGSVETQLVSKWLARPVTPEEKDKLGRLFFPEREQLCLLIETEIGALYGSQMMEYMGELLQELRERCASPGNFWCLPVTDDFSKIAVFLRPGTCGTPICAAEQYLRQKEEEARQQGLFFNVAGQFWRSALTQSGEELGHALRRRLNLRFFRSQEPVIAREILPSAEVPAFGVDEELLLAQMIDLQIQDSERYLEEQIDAYAQKPGASSKALKRNLSRLMEFCSGKICERYSITDQAEKVEEYIAQIEHCVKVERQKNVLHLYLQHFGGLLEIYKNHKYNLVMDQCMTYIQENYSKDLSLEEIARRFDFNYSYFSSYFKKISGLKFTDYLAKVRLQKAKDLLRTTDKKVYDIALEVGYANSQYFYRVFKKEFGLSPEEFRRRKL